MTVVPCPFSSSGIEMGGPLTEESELLYFVGIHCVAWKGEYGSSDSGAHWTVGDNKDFGFGFSACLSSDILSLSSWPVESFGVPCVDNERAGATPPTDIPLYELERWASTAASFCFSILRGVTREACSWSRRLSATRFRLAKLPEEENPDEDIEPAFLPPVLPEIVLDNDLS